MLTKKDMYALVAQREDLCVRSCRQLWNNPEESGTEKASADHFRRMLADEGFAITNEPRLGNCFLARYGSGAPVVALLGEYDALPGLSQKAVARKEPVVAGGPGHGCGHNLLGSASATAAVAIRHFLEKSGLPGTLRFYGCPEEELLSGKVKMADCHMFEGCDIAISWHPMSANMVYDSGYLAMGSAHFRFFGRSSHASFAPELGRSALDAVELMNVGVNYLREHVTSRARIHYTTDSGGFSPNIVPPRAGSWYFVRAPRIADVKEILERVRKIAQGACLMTETTMEMTVDYGCCELLENHAYGDLAHENMREAGVPQFTAEEMEYARQIEATLDPAAVERLHGLYGATTPLATALQPRNQYEKTPLTASSDSGDVSHMMPMCTFSTACWPVAVAPHTWQAVACTGSSIGEKGAVAAARIMAGIAYDLFTKPGVREALVKEFREKKTDYAPMIDKGWSEGRK